MEKPLDNPCRFCVAPQRYPGCHDHCAARSAWLKDNQRKKEYIKQNGFYTYSRINAAAYNQYTRLMARKGLKI